MEQELVLRVGRAIAHTLAEPDAGSQLHGIVALVGHVEGNHVPFPGCLVEREDVLLSLCRHVLHPAQPKDVGSHQLQQEADISLFKKIHQEGPGQFQNLFSLVPHSQRSPSLARHEKEGKRKPSRETRYFCFRDSRGRCRLSMMSFDIRVSIITKKQKKGTLFSSPDKNKRKESPRSRGRILPFPYEIVSVC